MKQLQTVNSRALIFIHTPFGMVIYMLSVWLFYAIIRGFILDYDVALAADHIHALKSVSLKKSTVGFRDSNEIDILNRIPPQNTSSNPLNISISDFDSKSLKGTGVYEKRVNNPSKKACCSCIIT